MNVEIERKLTTLKAVHKDLELDLMEADLHYDEILASKIKKEKLRIKDEMERLKKELET